MTKRKGKINIELIIIEFPIKGLPCPNTPIIPSAYFLESQGSVGERTADINILF